MTKMESTPVSQTFRDTRLVNSSSVELVQKGKLDVRLSQRFGELLDYKNIGSTFFGLETVTDIALGVEYGLLDNVSVGISRAKGAGVNAEGEAGLRQLINGTVKYRALSQAEGGAPITLTLLGVASVSAQEKTEVENQINSFEKFNHRMAYHAQLMAAHKFSDLFSLQVSGAYTHRNLAFENDDQGLISAGLGARVQPLKWLGIVADATFPFSDIRTSDNGYYPVYGVGLELSTGCNTFQINLTNATGITETDYIPYNTAQWSNGDFRLGFTLAHTFGFKKKSAEVNE